MLNGFKEDLQGVSGDRSEGCSSQATKVIPGWSSLGVSFSIRAMFLSHVTVLLRANELDTAAERSAHILLALASWRTGLDCGRL